MSTTVKFQEGNWAQAEVWTWTDGEGSLVGYAHLQDGRCQIRLVDEQGRLVRWLPGTFPTPAKALAAVRKALGL